MQNVHFSPAEIGRMMGVHESTVKRWIDAGLLTAFVTSGGHRRVREDDIRTFMRTGSGRASAHSYHLRRASHTTCTDAWKKYYTLHKSGKHVDARQYVTGFLFTHGSVQKVISCVIAPALIEIGSAWHRGELDIADEHRMSFRIRGDVYALDGLLPAPTRTTPRIVLACVPGENHEIALALSGLLAHEAGWDPVPLGINVPEKEIVRAVSATPHTRAIALTKIYGRARDACTYIRTLHHAPTLRTIPILLGGSGWNTKERAVCATLPRTMLCATLDDFAHVLLKTTPQRSTPQYPTKKGAPCAL